MNAIANARAQIDISEVKAAAASIWPELLTEFGGIAPDLLDGKHHTCPKCGGSDRFRVFADGTGGAICNQCFREGNGDGLATLQWLTGDDFRTVLHRLADRLGINGGGAAEATDIVEHVARLKRMPLESFVAFGAHEAQRGKLTVARMPVYNADREAHSYFDLPRDGGKGWLKEGKGSSGLMLPHDNSEPIAPRAGEMWAIAEGKDAVALHGLGYRAVSLPGCRLPRQFAGWFRGVHVLLIPHRDKAGLEGAEQIARLLHGVAASVRIAALPAEYRETKGDDVRDVLKMPSGEALVRQAIEAAGEWKPDEKSKETRAAPLHLPSGRTDAANAARFVAKHGRDILWCDPWGKWLPWDGRRWKFDDLRRVDELAKRVGCDLWQEVAQAGSNPKIDAKGMQEIVAFARASNNARGLRGMLELVRSDVSRLPQDFDADPMLLNVQNGTIDLRTGRLLQHRREDYITKVAPIAYRPTAKTETWLRFLGDVFQGNADLIGFVRRLLGYCLTGDTREHVLPIFHGAGANGKSTLIETVMAVMGDDYASPAASELLLVKKGQTHPTEIADLHGKRLMPTVETDDGRRLAEGLVKQLTGGDKLKARRMREDFWHFTATHKLLLACNHKPEVRGTDNGIWRRIRLVPFDVTFTNPDTTMGDKLRAEAEGILAWLVQGCREWQAEGLNAPPEVMAATDDYRAEQDTLAAFIAECCVTGSGQYNAPASLLLDAYRDYSRSNVSQRKFGELLIEKGFARERYTAGPHKGRIGWWGIGLMDVGSEE